MATFYHAKIGRLILIVLVQLHVAVILCCWLSTKKNLVVPMLTGGKDRSAAFVSSHDRRRGRILAQVTMALCLWSACSLPWWAT